MDGGHHGVVDFGSSIGVIARFSVRFDWFHWLIVANFGYFWLVFIG